ncbi:MAG: 4-hydroxy-3-methylbut-2-enyl diphosphate reductase, partial [Dehalococcoidia bacterium]|nr:4-hydroxy-3-methylbut-2-enyl diphosphate reductase [Dehalococcoidia bacterium]
MKIEKAEKLGLCFGVRRAIKLLKEAANKYGEIETLGPVAHNRLLVEALANLGVKPINRLAQAQGRILAITTHGTGPAILSEIKARHIRIIDTTCPIVRKAQNAARELAETGFDV